ncbi:MAG: HDOD domain-containing protein [Desulfovibrionaceae bacterium]
MSKINVNELSAGMVLSEDVFGPDGRMLLSQGTTLEDRHLRILLVWGVTEAKVMPETLGAEDGEAGLPQAVREQATLRIDQLFSQCGTKHEALAELHRQCVNTLGRNMLRGEARSLPCRKPNLSLPTDPPPELDAFLTQADIFLSFPETFFRIVQVIDDPGSTAAHLADVVGKDPGMSAKLLKLVNSPFYGFPQQIENLERGIALVGTRELSQLALGITIIQTFNGIPSEILSTREVWGHSLACGVFARLLASYKPGVTEETLFVAGILHDTGRLIMLDRLPQFMALAITVSMQENIPLHQAERRVFGWDHADLARALFQRWGLPASLRDAAYGHHAPSQATDNMEAALLHFADIMAIALEYGYSGNCLVPPLEEDAWDSLQLAPSVIAPVIAAGTRQIDDIVTFFLG